MAVGQVGFKDNRKVKRIHVEKRENPIVNRLNKTKVEKYPDLAMEKEARLKELRKKDQANQQARVRCSQFHRAYKSACYDRSNLHAYSFPDGACSTVVTDTRLQRKEEARVAKERKEKAYQRDHAYDDLFSEENVMASSNQDRSEDFLDDFF